MDFNVSFNLLKDSIFLYPLLTVFPLDIFKNSHVLHEMHVFSKDLISYAMYLLMSRFISSRCFSYSLA